MEFYDGHICNSCFDFSLRKNELFFNFVILLLDACISFLSREFSQQVSQHVVQDISSISWSWFSLAIIPGLELFLVNMIGFLHFVDYNS